MRNFRTRCKQNKLSVAVESLEPRCLLTIGSFVSVTREPDNLEGGIRGTLFAADIEGDGDFDLIHGTYAGELLLFENDNGISLDNPGIEIARFPESGAIGDFEVADIDGDGDLDFIATSVKFWYDKTIAWFENTGNSYEFNFVDRVFSFVSTRLAMTDVDGDGIVDILLPGAKVFINPFWYRNTGNGEFEPQRIFEHATSLGGPPTIADIDLDGDLDVISIDVTRDDNEIRIAVSWRWVDMRTGESEAAIELTQPITSIQSDTTVDVDGDGDLDVVIQEWEVHEHQLVWYENDGDGRFTNRHVIASLVNDYDVAIRDFDMDGDFDFAETSHGGILIIHENLGGNRFRTVTSPVDDFSSSYSVAIDVDGDNDLDIVSYDGYLKLFEHQIPQVGDSNGDGQFDSADLVAVFIAGEFEDNIENNSTFADGDWNGDGEFDTSDLIFAFQSDNFVRTSSDIAAFAADSVFGLPDDSLKTARCRRDAGLPRDLNEIPEFWAFLG